MSRQSNNKGVTLVELVIGIAITGFIVVAIAQIVISVSKNYTYSASQTIVMSQAQNTTNQITQMIMDATDTVVYFYANSSGDYAQILNDSEIADASNGNRKIEITTNGIVKAIIYDSEAKTISYAESAEDSEQDYGLLSEYVTAFSADTTDYEENRTVCFKIEFTYEKAKYTTEFRATARNEAPGEYKEIIEPASFQINPKEVYLEPNEEYVITCQMTGGNKETRGKYTASLSNTSDYANTSVRIKNDKLTIHVGEKETGNWQGIFYIHLSSVEKKEDNSPAATAMITVRVRRVTELTGRISLISGTDGKKDARYRVEAGFNGTNLDKATGNKSDTNYVDPRTSKFWIMLFKDESYVDANSRIEVTYDDGKYYEFKLKTDLDAPGVVSKNEIRVFMSAYHPLGGTGNRSGQAYGSAETVVKYIVWGDEIKGFSLDDNYKRNYENILNMTGPTGFISSLGYSNTGDVDAVTTKSWLYRFREVNGDGYGEWSNFKQTQEQGAEAKFSAYDSIRLLPDKYYQIQFIFVAADTGPDVLYYPMCPELLKQPGFENYKKGWNSATQKEVSLESCIGKEIYIGPIELVFNYAADNEFEGGVHLVGTKEMPKQLSISKWAWANIDISTIYFHFNSINEYDIKAFYELETLNEAGNWEKVDYVSKNYPIQISNKGIRIYNVYNIPRGKYRIKTGIVWPLYYESSDIYLPYDGMWKYRAENPKERAYYFCNETTGKGMIYFDIVD